MGPPLTTRPVRSSGTIALRPKFPPLWTARREEAAHAGGLTQADRVVRAVPLGVRAGQVADERALVSQAAGDAGALAGDVLPLQLVEGAGGGGVQDEVGDRDQYDEGGADPGVLARDQPANRWCRHHEAVYRPEIEEIEGGT